MKIHRCHDYDPIMKLRAEAARVPAHWLEAVEPWKLIVLPDDLKPTWIGLVTKTDGELHESAKHYGDMAVGTRTWDTMGGWCASEEHAYWFTKDIVPHIYLDYSSVDSVVHEMSHALERAWHVDTEALFRPKKALYEYMGTTKHEYFACAVSAFLRPDNDDKHWNRLDLAGADREIHDFLVEKLKR